MDWHVDGKAAGTILAATALTALGWWSGNGLHPLWWLMFLAPLPVLWLAPRVPARWAALSAFAGAAAGGFDRWNYLHRQIGLPLPVIAWVIAVPGVMLAVCALLFRRLVRSGHPLAAALVVPSLWTALEYANALVSPHGTFGAIAYTQMDALPLLQLAAVTGLWGIGFLVLLFPAALAAACASTAGRKRWTPLALTCALLGAAVACGAWRLHEPAVQSVRVGLVSLERPVRPALASAEGQALLDRYVSAIGQLADRGARMVVIPETSFSTADATVPALAAIARQRDLVLDAGIDYKGDPAGERNLAMAFLPGDAAPLAYAKHHLIPGFESQYRPGTGQQVFGQGPRIGLAICKDMDFHDTGAAQARLGAQLLLVPAWDFGVDGWLHSRMAIMRGVENGFAIARAARTGRLTLSDDRGRVVAEASSEDHDAALVGDLPIHAGRTLYSRWGDWFAWLDMVVLAGCLSVLLSQKP